MNSVRLPFGSLTSGSSTTCTLSTVVSDTFNTPLLDFLSVLQPKQCADLSDLHHLLCLSDASKNSDKRCCFLWERRLQ